MALRSVSSSRGLERPGLPSDLASLSHAMVRDSISLQGKCFRIVLRRSSHSRRTSLEGYDTGVGRGVPIVRDFRG